MWGPSRWLSLAGEARGSARARGILEALPWRQAEARPSNGTSKARYAFVGAGGVRVSQTPNYLPDPPLLANLGCRTCLVGGCVLLLWSTLCCARQNGQHKKKTPADAPRHGEQPKALHRQSEASIDHRVPASAAPNPRNFGAAEAGGGRLRRGEGGAFGRGSR